MNYNNFLEGNRDPTNEDIFGGYYLNIKSKEFFIRSSLGWFKIPIKFIENNQPDRLSPRDHIVVDNEMISDSQN